jgi:hypothetical protein
MKTFDDFHIAELEQQLVSIDGRLATIQQEFVPPGWHDDASYARYQGDPNGSAMEEAHYLSEERRQVRAELERRHAAR